MNKNLSGIRISVLITILFAIFCGCTSQTGPGSDTVEMEQAETTVDQNLGYYENKELEVSFSWPRDVFPFEGKTEGNTVLSVSSEAGIPILNLIISPIQGEKLPLEELGEALKSGIKEAFPDSKRHKVLKSQKISLANSKSANYSVIKWKYKGALSLVTVAVTAYKNDKQITVSCSSVPGRPSMEKIERWVKAIKL